MFIVAIVYSFKGLGIAPFIAVFLILLFIAVSIYDKKFEKIYLKYIALKTLNEGEISLIEHDASAFRQGSKFIDLKHDYSFDLDMFEPNSLFQHINRTASIEGETRLADMLLNIEKNETKIVENALAIQELSDFTDIRQNVTITGMKKQIELNELIKYANAAKKIRISKSFMVFTYISAAVTITSITLYLLKILPSVVPFSMFIFQLILSVGYRNKINSLYSNLNNAAAGAEAYGRISSLTSKQTFKSDKLNKITNIFSNMEKETKHLDKILNDFDYRNNGIIYIALNGMFLKDIFAAHKTISWFTKNENNMTEWLETTAEFEALCSFAGFAFNNPDFVFPELSKNKILQAENLCHPLIPKDKRVGNDISINTKGEFFIITGANMAGKSTFIRSVGINMVLASCGAPVCASIFKFNPISLFTSMRTSDKLLESSSYFQAELARLKIMKEKINTNNLTLVLLDEILKGTNSEDKLKGSHLILEKLSEMNATGLVSTHDTALCSMEDENPKHFRNYSFEFGVDDKGELLFDYKLRSGASKNMNAGILLKQIFN